MRAVWTRARSDLRRHMRSAIVLSLLIGLTSALVLAAAEGAQRTDTAYARLRVAVNAPDEIVGSGTGTVEALIPHVDFSKVALLPQVKATREMAYMLGEGVGADGKALFGGVTQGSSIWDRRPSRGNPPCLGRSSRVVCRIRREAMRSSSATWRNSIRRRRWDRRSTYDSSRRASRRKSRGCGVVFRSRVPAGTAHPRQGRGPGRRARWQQRAERQQQP